MIVPLFVILLLCAAHFVGDFICQTDYMATGKSTKLKPLLVHIATYSFVLFLAALFIFDIVSAFIFAIVNGILHLFIDMYTSKWTSSLRKQGKMGSNRIPNLGFFSVIGFDQLLHMFSLFITYSLMVN